MDNESEINNYTINGFKSAYKAGRRGAKQGGDWGVSTPPEFWMGGLNTCQPPLILRNFF